MTVEINIKLVGLKLSKKENEFLTFFLDNLSEFLTRFIKKDRQYNNAWRNMPYQSCLIRAREKLLRLLSLPNIEYSDMIEEIGDSIMYELFSLYQFKHGFLKEASSKKAEIIDKLLGGIEKVKSMSEEELNNLFTGNSRDFDVFP